MKSLTKWRRDRAVDKVIYIGKQIQGHERTLHDMDYNDNTAPDWEYISETLSRLSRKRDKLLDYLKDSA